MLLVSFSSHKECATISHKYNLLPFSPHTDNLGLSDFSYFYYLNQSGTYQVDGTNDASEFEDTMVSGCAP